jgi:hypothetical protein
MEIGNWRNAKIKASLDRRRSREEGETDFMGRYAVSGRRVNSAMKSPESERGCNEVWLPSRRRTGREPSARTKSPEWRLHSAKALDRLFACSGMGHCSTEPIVLGLCQFLRMAPNRQWALEGKPGRSSKQRGEQAFIARSWDGRKGACRIRDSATTARAESDLCLGRKQTLSTRDDRHPRSDEREAGGKRKTDRTARQGKKVEARQLMLNAPLRAYTPLTSPPS